MAESKIGVDVGRKIAYAPVRAMPNREERTGEAWQKGGAAGKGALAMCVGELWHFALLP